MLSGRRYIMLDLESYLQQSASIGVFAITRHHHHIGRPLPTTLSSSHYQSKRNLKVHVDLQNLYTMSVQNAVKEDAWQMAEILYEGLRIAKYWPTVYPAIQRENFIDAQANYCLHHTDEPNSTACVTKDDEGNVTGMAYGRFLTKNVTQAKCKVIVGRDDAEFQKMDNGPFRESLIDKYGGIFCKRRILFPVFTQGNYIMKRKANPLFNTGVEMFAVSRQHQGKGLGKALLEALVTGAKRRRVNIALSGVEGNASPVRKVLW